ncbi:cyclic nucleotide-binding domain-containing protein [Lyngbya confervoides]|uniref:Mechanosensitive ion channel n=1 Tax=Lyngbya confervoides BDU141951 TaxID=1574623 RepID=A0ABD4SZW1_9CYAN|nr:cyclic nucleotide-binding domain-containing protein [Lyngbya confervoides]MCM1981803.1 mechanosensitive ion channel [Lyngbya confervoides BDU141951]
MLNIALGGMRLLLWIYALLVGIRQIPQLASWTSEIESWLSQIPRLIYRAFSLGLIDFGDGNRITLLTLLTVVAIAVLIFLGSNLLGRWLRQKILSRTRIERGSQEAISALVSYGIAIFSFIILLQSVGLNLSSLTVFAGVIGIGFGLGLQELAKNFVSGLTLLFEQQLRVGDFVQVEDILGTIEAISIRSTIIRTQDRLYVVLPNHRFFDNNVVNWTYRSRESRIHLPVNVAYGTDTILVTETLLSVARMEPRVLSFPAPKVWFKSFGESAYEFELLAWINQPQEVDPIKSALNYLIEQEFKRRNIVIPFPQRELWIRRESAIYTESLPEVMMSGAPLTSKSVAPSVAPLNKRTLRYLLRNVSYFQHCSNAQLLLLIEEGFRQLFEARQIICRENDLGECFYLILAGQVEVYSEKLGQVLATLGQGEFFGEISLFTGVPRSATVRSLEETTLFVVNRLALQKLLQDYQELAEHIAQALSQRQQVLEELGLTQTFGTQECELPLFNIRQRIKTLFGL